MSITFILLLWSSAMKSHNCLIIVLYQITVHCSIHWCFHDTFLWLKSSNNEMQINWLMNHNWWFCFDGVHSKRHAHVTGKEISKLLVNNIMTSDDLGCLPKQSTHWGRVTHICVCNLTTIGSDNGLSPSRHQAIIWTNAGILSIGHLGTNFSEILIEIHTFSFKKMHLKRSSGKWQPFCLGLNVLRMILTYIALLS